MVEDDEVGVGSRAQRGDLLDLALAGEGRGIRALPRPVTVPTTVAPADVGERVELGHPLGAVGVAEIERDEQRAVAALGRSNIERCGEHAAPRLGAAAASAPVQRRTAAPAASQVSASASFGA